MHPPTDSRLLATAAPCTWRRARRSSRGSRLRFVICRVDVGVRQWSGRRVEGALLVARFEGHTVRTLWVDVGLGRRIRLRLQDGAWTTASEWFRVGRDQSVTVTVRALTEYDVFEIAAGERFQAAVPMSEWNTDWYSVPTLVRLDLASSAAQARAGVQLDEVAVAPAQLCERLVRSARR